MRWQCTGDRAHVKALFHQLPSSYQPIVICHLHLLVECFAVVPYCTINELPRGSIDHSWPLLRWALLWAPPGLAFSHECPGTLPSVDLSDDSKVGIPASAERSLWEWIFSSCHPRLPLSWLYLHRQSKHDHPPSPRGKIASGIKRHADVSLQRNTSWIT